MSPTLSLACELIRRASVTPADAGCQDIMIERLSALGFRIEKMPFGEVTNFWAERGEDGPIMVFAGHTDVVPTGPEANWSSPPFEPTLTDGMLRGRGAADMKGSLAAMITACEDFIGSHPNHRGRIGFLITSDEEGPAVNGTEKVINALTAQGRHIDWCLVGEPSSTATVGDVVKNGRRGSLGAVMQIHGKQGHIAYPHLADNPIHHAMPALAALVAEHWDEGNAFFPATSLQLSNFNAGTGASNVIPGEVALQFNFRFSTEVTADELKQRTQAILDSFNLNYDIQWRLFGNPFLTDHGELVDATCAAITEVTGQNTELSTSGGTSDGRYIAPTGAQVIELGPCNDSIHQIDEAVSVADLEQLSTIYSAILRRLLVDN